MNWLNMFGQALKHPFEALRVGTAICRGTYYRNKYRLLRRKVIIGSRFRVYGRGFKIKGPGMVVFGNDCTILTYSTGPTTVYTHSADAITRFADRVQIASSRFGCKKLIEVGYGTGISEAQIMDTDFHDIEVSDRLRYNTEGTAKPVFIGPNVWVCPKSIVLKGVTIGENSVVGAGTVVRENVPPNVLVIGNPAYVARYLKGKYSHPVNSRTHPNDQKKG